MQFSGVVGKHFPKAFGNKTFYSFTLRGQDGFFNTGIKRPPAEGVSVAFEADTNAKGYMEVNGKTLQIQSDNAASPAPTVSQYKRQVGGVQKDEYWQHKEDRDVRNDALRELGASRNTAISIVDLMVKHEAIKLPAVAKREEFIWEVINRYTDKLMAKESETQDAEPAKQEAKVEAEENWN